MNVLRSKWFTKSLKNLVFCSENTYNELIRLKKIQQRRTLGSFQKEKIKPEEIRQVKEFTVFEE
jgi:hypothetical protein